MFVHWFVACLHYSSAVNLLRVLEEKYFKELQEIEVEGERVPPPKPLSW
jgi:hypothetical protein